MADVVVWTPGTLKQPGDLVRPTNSGIVSQTPLENGSFDSAVSNTHWVATGNGSWEINSGVPVFDGTLSGKAGFLSSPDGQFLTVENDTELACVPGQIIVARCVVFGPTASGDSSRVNFCINWYSSSDQSLGSTKLPLDNTIIGLDTRVDQNGLIQYACREIWLPLEVEGIAPAQADHFKIGFIFAWGDMPFAVDQVSVDYANVEDANNLLFRAVQSAAGFTGNNEPTWPTSIGLQVVDNEVTWEAVSGTSVTWQASRILVSACPESNEDVEPTWPTLVNGTVPDGSIIWQLDSRRVTDERLPHESEIVLIAASKVYAADEDIINYSATVNPLDWTTEDDAGYIGFGLQQYGKNPVTALGLYRGNVAAFNSEGCQIWQVDEDPAAITFLDAIPVPCTYPKSLAPVGDDLAVLTNLGIRSLGVAGAEVNLQGGYFGKQVDPLVVEAIAEALEEGWTPRGLYWPAQGQYWLFFGPQAFVLTINGPEKAQRSWSRYVFPWTVDNWTIMGTDLYLRAGDLVERVDPDALLDDQQDVAGGLSFDVTVANDGGDAYGFDSGNFGSVDPDPITVGTAGALIVESVLGWFEIFLDGGGDETFPAEYTTLIVETASGTVELDLTNPDDQTPWYYAWNTNVWGGADVGEVRTITFSDGSPATVSGEEFEGVIHWPYLDLNTFNADKELIGFDLSIEGVCEVSIGYDQRFLEFDASTNGTWTTPYEIDGDTVPGQMIPFSVTGPSLAMRLSFAGNQAWKWYSANLYIKDAK